MTTIVPSVIIFMNNDVSDSVQETIIRQLHIDIIMTGDAFDGYVAANDGYTTVLKSNNKRVLVIRPFDNYSNRTLADVAIYVRNGLAAVELTKIEKNGPPGFTYPVVNLCLPQILGLMGYS